MKKLLVLTFLCMGCGSYEMIDRKVKIIDVFSGDYNTVVVSYERQDGSRHSIGVRVPKAIPSAVRNHAAVLDESSVLKLLKNKGSMMQKILAMNEDILVKPDHVVGE